MRYVLLCVLAGCTIPLEKPTQAERLCEAAQVCPWAPMPDLDTCIAGASETTAAAEIKRASDACAEDGADTTECDWLECVTGWGPP